MVMLVQQFDKLTDYTKYLDNLNQHFSLKIMGQKTSSTFHTATMLADIYAQTDNPDFGVPAQAPFGQIRKRGVILELRLLSRFLLVQLYLLVSETVILQIYKPTILQQLILQLKIKHINSFDYMN